MRKALVSLVFGLILSVTPVYAQRHGGGARSNSGHSSGNTHAQVQPRGGYHPAPTVHPAPARPGFGSSAEARTHWDGRRFDRPYFAAHWGPAHPFFWGRVGWWGPRWAIGSRFWFGGAWFSIIDPIPYYWYNDQVTVIYDEDCGCYYAVDPVYPGVRIHIGIVF
jgi:hypothetical protein